MPNNRGNAAIDSNALTTGAITVSGGIVIAFSTTGGAECALDADNAALVVSGGYLFAACGSSSNGGFASSAILFLLFGWNKILHHLFRHIPRLALALF